MMWKKKHALSPLVLNFASEYVIRNEQENTERLKLTGIHQLLIYADDKIYWAETLILYRETTEALLFIIMKVHWK